MAAVGQGGKPEDVGQAITFLATPGAVWGSPAKPFASVAAHS